MMRSYKIHILILAIIAIGIYVNSVGGKFVYDDKSMISGYDLVKDINNMPKAFVSATSVYGNRNYYRPVQTVSYMVDYFLWGKFPSGFHITNIFFHLSATLLVYAFTRLVSSCGPLAFVAALLFAVHPAHTGTVSYIAGRADPMLCFFMLACLIFFIRARFKEGGWGAWAFSVVFFALSLMTKELALIIPLIFVLLEYSAPDLKFTKNRCPTRIGYYVPFLIVVGLYVLARLLLDFDVRVEGAMQPFPFGRRVATAPFAMAQYIRILFLPYDLHIERLHWVADSMADDRVVLSIVVLAALFTAAFINRKKEPLIWFGLCWFALTIFPSLSVITPLFYTFADNWFYIPSIGLFLAVAALLRKIYDKLTSSTVPIAKHLVTVGIFLACVAFGAVTVEHNFSWRDEISVDLNTLKFNPYAFKSFNNLGVTYLYQGDLDKAEAMFTKCLEIKPDTAMAYFNLYRVYAQRGDGKRAQEFLEKARQFNARDVNVLIKKMGL